MKNDPKLHGQINFRDFLSTETSEIVDSDSFLNGDWKKLSKQSNFPGNVSKTIFPVNIDYANFLVLTEVEAGSEFTAHSHDEPMFRIMISGSMTLNGKTYAKGDWVFVPAGVPYEISTNDGYTTMSGYGMECVSPDIH